MKKTKSIQVFLITLGLLCVGVTAQAGPMSLPDKPLQSTQSATPMTMFVMTKDHTMFREAYNDAMDLNNDGVIDSHYKPDLIDYYGYFNSTTCYQYQGHLFVPKAKMENKKCGTQGLWSGDFLNYLTMTRMDIVRKTLYGGHRVGLKKDKKECKDGDDDDDDCDDDDGGDGDDDDDDDDDDQGNGGSSHTKTPVVLERVLFPNDEHMFGKEYTNPAVDGYHISDYSPLNIPLSGKRHILYSMTNNNNGKKLPVFRVASNTDYRLWELVTINPDKYNQKKPSGWKSKFTGPAHEFIVRVEACNEDYLENNCKLYPNGHYMPVGTIQALGENDGMKFGLLTNTYKNYTDGGVIRKNMGSIRDEINATTGEFTNANGIISTIEKLKIHELGQNYNYRYRCGYVLSYMPYRGECDSWTYPMSEMYYETLRYLSGHKNPTSRFDYSGNTVDKQMGLPKPTWVDPNSDTNISWCAKRNVVLIGSEYPTYDSYDVPGSIYGHFTGDLIPLMNATTLGTTIWNQEFGGSRLQFVGESGNNDTKQPTAKLVSSFGTIRGIYPDQAFQKGTYYTASMAYYGWLKNFKTVNGKKQNIVTYAMGFPKAKVDIEISVNGKKITFIPYARTVGGCSSEIGPTVDYNDQNPIIDFFVESETPTSGVFRVNFGAFDRGGHSDMDAMVRYEYNVLNNGTVDISLESMGASSCAHQHLGYIISGTTADGSYLVVRDSNTNANKDPDYILDVPPNVASATARDRDQSWRDHTALPLESTRNFKPSGQQAATLLKSPLWYAAKWGGFNDFDRTNMPDKPEKFDSNGDGIPDNYLRLPYSGLLTSRLKAANESVNNTNKATGTSVTLSQSALNNNARLYQAVYYPDKWSGEILAYALDPTTGEIAYNGSGPNGSLWEAGTLLNTKDWKTGRHILSYRPDKKIGIPFFYDNMSTDQKNLFKSDPITNKKENASKARDRIDYLRGNRAQEQQNGGSFRNRSGVLGDAIHAQPLYVPNPNFPNYMNWPSGSPEAGSDYAKFATQYANRTHMLYAGTNDGQLHAFNAKTGEELFAYMPASVYQYLPHLSLTSYEHHYFVDGSPNFGDVFFGGKWHTVLVGGLNKGGQGIYALDVTDPTSVTENNAAKSVLWEFTDQDDRDLGYTFSRPMVVRMSNGRWAAVFGNGYNNTVSNNDRNVSQTGNGVLYIVDIETGTLIKKLDTKVGSSSDPTNKNKPNGIATPLVVDVNGDHIADYIYVGDLFGNLWKIDVRNPNPSNWDFAFKKSGNPTPLFVARDKNGQRQPITSQPNAMRVSAGKPTVQIFFGTGRYLTLDDLNNKQIQTFYAIRDDHTHVIPNRSSLLAQTITGEGSSTANGVTSTFRTTSNHAMTPNKKGWYMDLSIGYLARGERSLFYPQLRNGKVIFSTVIPSDNPCEIGGNSWLMELNAITGARLEYSPLDINHDGFFTKADFVKIVEGNQTIDAPVSGVKSTVGMYGLPAIINAGKKEYKYNAGARSGLSVSTENPGYKVHGRQSWRQIK